MKNINKNNQQEIIHYRTKFFFIGFIVGIIPYLIMILIFSQFNKFQQLVNFKETIVVIGIITSLCNGLILQHKIAKKIT